ncbi:MAG: hypothetical protein V9F03_14420 [Microthrixaceae bacterium]
MTSTCKRTLALLDVENLLRRWPDDACSRDYEYVIARAAAITGLTRSADVVIGVGNRNRVGVFAARQAWPGAALRCRAGRDGGELSLLHHAFDLDAIERTYDRVVIGSGDFLFAEFAETLTERSVRSVVVAWRHKLSRRLRRAASEVRFMDSELAIGAVEIRPAGLRAA